MQENPGIIRVRSVDDSWAVEYADGTALYFSTSAEAVNVAHKACLEYGLTFLFEAESGPDERFAHPS